MSKYDFKNKITITLEDGVGDSKVTSSFSITQTTLTKDEALDWFEHQVLPALGYANTRPSAKGGE